MLRRMLVATAVAVLLGVTIFGLQITVGRSKDAVSRHKRSEQELPRPFPKAVAAKDSTTNTTGTTKTTLIGTTTTSIASTTTTPTTTICKELLLTVSLTPSSDSIDVSWEFDDVCSTLEGFAVSWGDPLEGPVSLPPIDTAYTIQFLDPCQEYWVKVVAVGTVGPIEGNNTASTPAGAPPAVTSFTATSYGAYNVTLTWKRPDTACDVTDYVISYDGTAKWGAEATHSDNVTLIEEANTMEEFTVTGLVPYSSYSMCIVARVDNRNGAKACLSHLVDTEEDVPSEPINLKVDNSTETSILVSWEEPEKHNGILLEYQVTWSDGRADNGSDTTNDTLYTIEELMPCVNYTVTVTASTSIGEGARTDTSTTTADGPPPAVTNFTNTSSGAHYVTLTWTRPDTACTITEYVISYEGTAKWGTNGIDDNSVLLDSNASLIAEYTVTGLVPYSSYNICIVARVINMNGTKACLPQHVDTEEDVPSKPTSLNVDNSTETSILVSWEEPEEQNGILLEYQVTWSYDGVDNRSGATNDTLYTVDDLTACVDYTVTVTASTSIGEGAANYLSTTTDDEIPPPVDGLEALDVTSRSLTLSWTSPDTECAVTNYSVTYDGVAQWGDNRSHIASETEETESLMLVGLTPFSKYTVCVAAITSAGQGDTNCTETMTKEDKPTEPQDLQLTATNNSIVVNWEKPDEENGVLLTYNISWFGDHGVNGSFNVEDNVFEYEIDKLAACINIDVKVAASTSVGFGPESENNTRTLVEVPPSIDEVEVLDVNARNLNLSWSAPDTFCNVTSYTITYNGTALWEDNRTSNNVTTVEIVTLSLDGLTPFSKYTLCVAASTSAGPGDTNCIDTQTAEDAPSEPTNIELSELKAKKASITWGPPSDLNGNLIDYTVSVVDSENNTVGYPVTIPVGSKRLASFTDLEPETIYAFQVEACTKAGCSLASKPSTTPKSWTVLIVSVSVGFVVVVALVALIIVKRDALRNALKTDNTKKKKSKIDEKKSSGRFNEPIRNSTFDVKKHHISQCIKELKSNEGLLLQAEFEQMEKKSPTGTMNIATSPANYQKNRYANILPFDDNIVYLDSRTDKYVNASLVQDYQGMDLFIAGQGPMETTVTQFWQLIWEQNVENIVMLANCIENGKEKCAEYWPQLRQTKVLSQHFKIVNCSEEVNESFVVRTLEIRYKRSSRFVKQFHYTVWPDFGVPDDCASILDLMSAVKKSFVSSATEADRHLLVHCSAGVGRTGTFIGIWNLCHRDLNEDSDEINVMKEVLRMREKRVTMVQTPDQYLMLYKCFLEYYNNVTRWPLLETDTLEESSYLNLVDDANGNTSQQDPIYENISSQLQESIYENASPRQQQSISENRNPRQQYENRSPRQQESVYENRSPRQQESVYENRSSQLQEPTYQKLSTPQATRYRNESPRPQASSFRNRSPQQDDGIYENDSPSPRPLPQGGYDATGAQKNVYQH